MKREIQRKFTNWKNSKNRKPLLLRGARQVGKTWLLKQFGHDEFGDMAYFNFEEQPELKQFFETTKDVKRILENLSLVHGRKIVPEETLIVFDEIQECNEALNSLKYFCENAPEYAIAGAGSLLGVALSKGSSFPVGKVHFMDVTSLDFPEFLATADPALAVFLDDLNHLNPLPDIFFNRLVEKLKMYFISGGMPEAVTSLLGNGVNKAQETLQNILSAYALDFSKYAETKDVPRINHIWASIPSQLARENKKFLYKKVRTGARAREYEDALLWLSQAGLIYRIFCSAKPSLPLSGYDDLSAFKVYLLDVGLLRRLAHLDPIAVMEGDRLFTEFKGALTENFVLQHLISNYEYLPRYWNSGNKAEVDFLFQSENQIVPVEVKSDENIKSRSLTLFNQKFNPPMRIRYSLRNLSYKDGLLNIPLFLAGHTNKLVKMAMENIEPSQRH